MKDPILIGISLPAAVAEPLNRAAEIMRELHPLADDAELLALLFIAGVAGVIDQEINGRAPSARVEDDDTLCAIAEAFL